AAHADRRTCDRRRPAGEGLQDHPRGGRHFVRARARLDHRAPRRQRRRQDHHHRDDSGPGAAHLGHGDGAGRANAAPALPGAAQDEFREPLYRHAASAHGAAEPQGVRPALRGRGSRCPHRRAGGRARLGGVPRPADRQAFGRAEDPRRAREGADQCAGGAPARRADRFARSRYRRLGARPPRALPQAARLDRAARLPQHGRGRAAVRARHHHEAGTHRGRRHGFPPAHPLRPRNARAGIPRRRTRPRPNARGGAMSVHSAKAITFAPHRIAAMVLRYLYLLRSSWTRLLELIYWPAVQLFVWGFLQFYIAQNSGFFARASGVFIAAVLMWDVLFRGQLGFSVSFLEEMWSRNLANLMISPLRPVEFVCALMIMSILRLAIGMVPVTLLAIAFF